MLVLHSVHEDKEACKRSFILPQTQVHWTTECSSESSPLHCPWK